jgi:hypothetical protein
LIVSDWQEFEADDAVQYRAVLEGYLVFLRHQPNLEPRARRKQKRSSSGGEWFVHFVIPDDERERAYLAGEGFTSGATLGRAQEIATLKARELRGKLERKRR